MKLLAILLLGAVLAYWFFLRPAPSASPAPSATITTGTSAGSETAAPQPKTGGRPESDNIGSRIKRPIDQTRKAIDANRQRLEDEF